MRSSVTGGEGPHTKKRVLSFARCSSIIDSHLSLNLPSDSVCSWRQTVQQQQQQRGAMTNPKRSLYAAMSASGHCTVTRRLNTRRLVAYYNNFVLCRTRQMGVGPHSTVYIRSYGGCNEQISQSRLQAHFKVKRDAYRLGES